VQRLLTFRQLAERLQDRYQCTRQRLLPAGALVDTDGTPTPAVYAFTRISASGRQVDVVVYVYDEEAPVMDDLLRYVVDRLEIVDDAGLFDPHE